MCGLSQDFSVYAASWSSLTKATFHKICGLVLKMIRVSDFMSEASVLLEFKGLFLQIQDQKKHDLVLH